MFTPFSIIYLLRAAEHGKEGRQPYMRSSPQSLFPWRREYFIGCSLNEILTATIILTYSVSLIYHTAAQSAYDVCI